MLNMFPMAGMGSNGLGVAGGSGLDPRTLMLMQAMMGQGGGGMGAPTGTPLMPGGPSPMSQFIGARPPVGGMAPVVGGGMAGPPMAPVASPAAMQMPGAGGAGGMDIASILKNPAGLKALLDMLKGNQTGLTPTNNAPPTGGVPPQGTTAQGATVDPMAFLRQMMSLGGGGAPGMGQGYT